MTRSVRTRLEDAIVGALQGLQLAGLRERDIRPYAGELDVGKPEDITRALSGVRGILVSTGRGAFKGVSPARDQYHRDVEVTLYIVTGGGPTREARTRGDNQMYEILEGALGRIVALGRPDLGEDVACGVFEPDEEAEILHTPELLVWSQSYVITTTCDIPEQPAPRLTEVRGSVSVEGDEADVIVGATRLIT